jgi:hypothetical protein
LTKFTGHPNLRVLLDGAGFHPTDSHATEIKGGQDGE